MKFQDHIKRTVKVALFLLTVMVSCLVLQHYFLRNTDHNSLRIEGFYQEERDSLDVVFIGASDIYTSFMPGRAYEQYGFTSYNFASESITSEGVKTAVKEVVRTQHPGMVVVEANAFLYSDSDNDANEAHIHKFFDNLPLSFNKLEYIQKYVPVDRKWEYFFPLIKYHSLWTEYPERFYMMASNLSLDVRGRNYLKGFRTTAQIIKTNKECLNSKLSEENGEMELDPKLQAQLMELLDYAKKHDVNLLFVRAPHYVTKETYNRVKRSNKMASLVNSYGFSYYSFENDAEHIGIDPKRDFYNADHMNVYGALKFTDYLCEKILYREELKVDPLSEEQRENWNDVVKATNRLYRYCDDLMTRGEVRGAQEDVVTLSLLDNYSSAPIEQKEQKK
ncbi:MAG TPA: hypothetical protein DEO32_03660 [Ruminococcaceae bacterium]|nr:hypothetical protein [Oscillospiraceae bacterium]